MRRQRFPELKVPVMITLALIILGSASLLWLNPFHGSTAPAGSTLSSATTIKIVPPLVQQGGQIQISGAGFFPGEPVDLQVSTTSATNSSLLDLIHTQASFQGTIKVASVILPDNLYSGIYSVIGTGQISRHRATNVLYVHAKQPWITVSSSTVKPGTNLGFILGGFAPGEHVQVSIEPATILPNGQSQDPTKLSPATLLASVPTNRVGNSIWTEVKLPLLKPGGYNLVTKGISTGKKLTWEITVQPLTPVVELSPWSGPPGSKVELNARGFAPNETVDVFVDQGTQPSLKLTADQYGNFWGAGPVHVPYNVNSGTLTLRAVGEASGVSYSADFKVQPPKPWLELTQYWGMPGTPVGFSGGGWAADEEITFHVGSASGPEVAAGQTDDYGWLQFSGTGSVPSDATGTVTFVAVGSKSYATASATFKVVNPFADQSPNLPPTSP
ncbi:MAG TPA: hypothetical protein VKX96_06015 [Chloroflexota bacterium]|nr:hypothetical protein [Chloroflexota bacterium]